MLSGLQNQRLFGATIILWAFLAFTSFLGAALAAPSQELSRRATTPGIGVELEMGRISIVGPKPLAGGKREAIKGKVMTPVGIPATKKTNWELTAEVGPLEILPEVIVDGIKNKVGAMKTKDIGVEVFNFFKAWAPCAGKQCKVKIDGFDNLGEWKVEWPKTNIDFAEEKFSAQVTAAMPLGGVLSILNDSKNKAQNPLASTGTLGMNSARILTKKDFAPFTKISQADVTEEFLGFFSLLTSYCIMAKYSDPNKGPKHLLPVMPRTDFVAMYNMFIKKKLDKQLADKTTPTLYDIVAKISLDPNFAKQAFKWKPAQTVPIRDTWAGKEADLTSGILSVQKFLDHIQGYDRGTKKAVAQKDLLSLMDKTMRHGQIGSLGNKMETVLNTSKPAAIFEFRDLTPIQGKNLGTTLGSFENKVIEYHKHFAKRGIDG